MIAATTGFAGHANNAQQADCKRYKSIIEIIAIRYRSTTDIYTAKHTNIYKYINIYVHINVYINENAWTVRLTALVCSWKQTKRKQTTIKNKNNKKIIKK